MTITVAIGRSQVKAPDNVGGHEGAECINRSYPDYLTVGASDHDSAQSKERREEFAMQESQ